MDQGSSTGKLCTIFGLHICLFYVADTLEPHYHSFGLTVFQLLKVQVHLQLIRSHLKQVQNCSPFCLLPLLCPGDTQHIYKYNPEVGYVNAPQGKCQPSTNVGAMLHPHFPQIENSGKNLHFLEVPAKLSSCAISRDLANKPLYWLFLLLSHPSAALLLFLESHDLWLSCCGSFAFREAKLGV